MGAQHVFRRDERGFTLIELMVVVLIIGVLIAILIPTFLGARTKAQDRTAQVALRHGLLTAKTFFTDSQTYVATVAELEGLEPTISFDDAIGNADTSVIGYTGDPTSIVMMIRSSSGTYFCIADSISAGTTYGADQDPTQVDSVSDCDAASW